MADSSLTLLQRAGTKLNYGSAVGNETNEQLIAQGMPSHTEMTRKGRGWGLMSTSAVAALVVRPSTTAALEIYNGYSTGIALVIDRIFAFNLVSTNVAEFGSVWAMVTAPKAAPSTASFTIAGLSGKTYGGAVIGAVSTTVIDNKGWFPQGNGFSKTAGGVVPFGVIEAQIDGRIIVPPLCSLCLHSVAALVGDTYTHGATWYEETMTTE
jgi:hypothetical protein